MKTLTLQEVLEGAERASKRVAKWPDWKKKLSRSLECRDCKYCGMDMDMDPYCSHPDVLKSNPFGSIVNVVRGAPFIQDNRKNLAHFGLCGQEAKLFEGRKTFLERMNQGIPEGHEFWPVDVYRCGDELILCGDPPEEEDLHNCDVMGCRSHHVVGRAKIFLKDKENESPV